MLIQEIKKYVPKCKIGICAYDENKENIFSFDENIIIDAACTLKVFIMLEYMKQINEKRIIGNEYLIVTKENLATGAGVVKFLSYGIRVKANDLVELMISISDHMAANMLIDFLGLNNINETIRDFGFENTKLLKKYLVPHNKYVAKTTAYDYTNFFYMLDKNKFFNEESCKYMKDILFSQKYKDFLAEPLFSNNEYIDMASKSGKVDGRTFEIPVNSVMNDGGIVVTRTGNYYISFLSEFDSTSNVMMLDVKNFMHIVSKNILEEYLKK